MIAEVAQLEPGVEQLSRRLRDENLAAVARAHDARRPVHVGADIALVRHDRLTGVDADADAHGSACQRYLGLPSSGDRISGPRERDEERVSLGVHLDPAVARESLTQQPPMLGEQVRIALPMLVQESRRPLDVREEQRDRPARQRPHAGIISQRRIGAKSTMSSPATAHRR